MDYDIRYKPAFAAIFITLPPNGAITAEAGAMTSMDPQITMKTRLSGSFFSALLKKLFGGESLFVNTFRNPTKQPLKMVLTQATIGDIDYIKLKGDAFCFQPGAYIAHAGPVNLGVKWAGFKSWFSGEGLFKLQATGKGYVFFGAYGGLTKKRISGEFIVDTGHLVAYDPQIKINIALAGSLLGSVTSGEGFVNRLTGSGDIYLQSRSIGGFVSYLRPKFR